MIHHSALLVLTARSLTLRWMNSVRTFLLPELEETIVAAHDRSGSLKFLDRVSQVGILMLEFLQGLQNFVKVTR